MKWKGTGSYKRRSCSQLLESWERPHECLRDSIKRREQTESLVVSMTLGTESQTKLEQLASTKDSILMALLKEWARGLS